MSCLRTTTFRHLGNYVGKRNGSSQSTSAGQHLATVSNIYGGEGMPVEQRKTFEAWHKSVSNRDGSFMEGRLSPDVVFRPPTYFKPWKGDEELKVILTCVAEVFGSSFQYRRQWISPCGREWALEFEAEIGITGKVMNGIDLVSLDEDGKLCELTVLARPPNAVSALKEEMMRKVPPRMMAAKAKKAVKNVFGK